MDAAVFTPLTFDAVSKEFDDGTRALDGISLTINHGEFVSIVGPSGCGKSTLLRIAAGLDSPSTGVCATGAQRIGYVFQDATLLPWRTVQRNVELPLELRHASRTDRGARVAAALSTVGLADQVEKFPHQLSGGMRMRVSIARSLVTDPDLYLFDEPFGALDEMSRENLNDEVRAMFVDRGFAAAFVTHSISEAVYMSTRVVVMSARPGRIVADLAVELPLRRSHDIRYTPEFGDLCARVSSALRAGSA